MFKYVSYCPNIINYYLDGRKKKGKDYQKLDAQAVHSYRKTVNKIALPYKLDTHEVHKLDTHEVHELDTHVVQMLDTHEVHLQQKIVKTAPSFVEEDLQESSSDFYQVRRPRGAPVRHPRGAQVRHPRGANVRHPRGASTIEDR